MVKPSERLKRLKRPSKQAMHNHAIAGAKLADVAAQYFAFYPPMMREEVIEAWLEAMRRYMAANEGNAETLQ